MYLKRQIYEGHMGSLADAHKGCWNTSPFNLLESYSSFLTNPKVLRCSVDVLAHKLLQPGTDNFRNF